MRGPWQALVMLDHLGIQVADMSASAEVLHEARVRPEYHPDCYGPFVRDPDGNNVEAVCHAPEPTWPGQGVTTPLRRSEAALSRR